MKYLYGLFILFLLSNPIKSQTVTYSYDKSGNRKIRVENTLKSQQTNVNIETLLFGQEVLAYPNPTDSYLTVIISESSKSQGKIQLFNIVGELIYETKAVSGELNIDMHARPSGIYFLHVTIDGKTYLRKILKK